MLSLHSLLDRVPAGDGGSGDGVAVDGPEVALRHLPFAPLEIEMKHEMEDDALVWVRASRLLHCHGLGSGAYVADVAGAERRAGT